MCAVLYLVRTYFVGYKTNPILENWLPNFGLRFIKINKYRFDTAMQCDWRQLIWNFINNFYGVSNNGKIGISAIFSGWFPNWCRHTIDKLLIRCTISMKCKQKKTESDSKSSELQFWLLKAECKQNIILLSINIHDSVTGFSSFHWNHTNKIVCVDNSRIQRNTSVLELCSFIRVMLRKWVIIIV